MKITFWLKKTTMCRIWFWNFRKAFDFEKNTFKKITFWNFLLNKKIRFCLFSAFLKTMNLEQNVQNAFGCKLQTSQHLSFWIGKVTPFVICEKITTEHQISKRRLPSVNYVWGQLTPDSRHYLLFSCFFEKHILEYKFLECVIFRFRTFTTCQISIKVLPSTNDS